MTADQQDLRHYLAVLRRRRAMVIGITALAVAGALLYSLQQTPLYTASAEVLVRPLRISRTDASISGSFVRMETERRIASSQVILDAAARRMGQRAFPATLTVEPIADADTMVFRATSPDPSLARRSAQSAGEAYLDARREQLLGDLASARQPLEQRLEQLAEELAELQQRILAADEPAEETAAQVRFTSLLTERAFLEQKRAELIQPETVNAGEILQPAVRPTAPSSPDHARAAGFALFAGGLLAVGAAFLRDRLDDRVHGVEELETEARAPVLATIPAGDATKPVPLLSDPRSPVSEAYRTLATGLAVARVRKPIATVLITDLDAGAGGAIAVANLGVALALRSTRVTVAVAGDDGDDDDELAGMLGVWEEDRAAEAATPSEPSADGFARGPVPGMRIAAAGALLDEASWESADTLRARLRDVAGPAGIALIAGPPLGRRAETLVLAAAADAVIVVAERRRATRARVRTGLEQLRRADATILGVVLAAPPPSPSRRERAAHRRRSSARLDEQPAVAAGSPAAPT